MTRIDPYRAPVRTPPPAPTLPIGRFRRLGASEVAVTALGAWWTTVPHDSRALVLDHIAEMTDPELTGWLAGTEVPSGTAHAIVEWAETQPDPRFSAMLASLVEEATEAPRVTLLARLAKVD